jgi:hypothetical protein
VQIDADLYHIAALFPLQRQSLEILNDCRTNRGRIADLISIRLCSPPDLDVAAKSSLALAKSAGRKRFATFGSANSVRTPYRLFVNPQFSKRNGRMKPVA